MFAGGGVAQSRTIAPRLRSSGIRARGQIVVAGNMIETVQRPLSLPLRAYRFVNRPYYWYRPSQIVTRLRTTANPDGSPYLLRTAWGSQMYCFPDALGRAVARNGVYDLVVAEALARLADAGETAVDAGANVGFMSNLLAHAVGPSGRVVSFEPHPLIAETLSRNAARWRAAEQITIIEVRQAAVSSSAGMLPLAIEPDTFAHNKGTASLEQTDPANSTLVETVRLDELLPTRIGVLKLDVEGHELAALEGAESLLSRKLIRDILFEEHDRPPTPVIELLKAHGYTVIGIRQGLAGPIVSDPAAAYDRQLWHPPALLATSEPARVLERLRRRGWACLRRGFSSYGR
jgi:FkbM family methyltransferase